MRILMLFLGSILLIASCKAKKPVDYVLTDQDRTEYILSIDQNKITKPRDTTIRDTAYRLIHIPLEFHNESRYKLSYINSIYLTCVTNNSNFHFPRCELCDFIELESIQPGQSVVFNIDVIYGKSLVISDQLLRLGLNIQWFINKKLPWKPKFDSKSTQNIIWSNEVMVPGSN